MTKSFLHAALIAAAAFCANAASAAEPVTVAIEMPAGARDVEATLRRIVGEAPLTVIRLGGTNLVETDTIGYERLSADDALTSVRIVGAEAAADAGSRRARAYTGDVIEFTLRLTTTPRSGPAGAGIDAGAAADATHTARLTDRRRYADTLPPAGALGPGRLLVRALDAEGRDVTRTVIDDPRLVRSETVASNGAFGGRRDFLRSEATLRVRLRFDPRIASLAIATTSGGTEKELTRVRITR